MDFLSYEEQVVYNKIQDLCAYVNCIEDMDPALLSTVNVIVDNMLEMITPDNKSCVLEQVYSLLVQIKERDLKFAQTLS